MKSIVTSVVLIILFFNAESKNAIFWKAEFQDSSIVKSEHCKKINCSVYVIVNKSKQQLFVFLSGTLIYTFSVSTGIKGHRTPNMEHPFNGRLYKKYTSKKFPGGNYMGLGNMPYVMFVSGGFAIHGTTLGNIKYLGHTASHGCIRLHPNNAKLLFDLVKKVGVENTWVSIL